MLPTLVLMAIAHKRNFELAGRDVAIRVIHSGGELVEELYAVDAMRKRRLILVSPTHHLLRETSGKPTPNLLQGSNTGLFNQPPTFAFQKCVIDHRNITLTANAGDWVVVKTLTVPEIGNEIAVGLRATTNSPYPQIRFLLTTYAFAPDGKRIAEVGQPDSTWAPGFRPQGGQVMADHFFRCPMTMAQKGRLSAAIMPDLGVLGNNRPIPTILDLDCKNGVVDAPLMSYGFCDSRLVGHVYYSNDASMIRPVPAELHLGFTILLDANSAPRGAIDKTARLLWERQGANYFNKVLPQAMPFADYARVCYPAAFNEKETGGWFERTIGGHACGGMASGWGRESGWVSWQSWFNQLRSAWGLHWWGSKLGERDWVERSDKMLNLALAAPIDRGACPTTYLSKTNEWKGSLITPMPDCYYDLTNIAWKGIWMIRWLQFADCPRRQEIASQIDRMAGMMMRFQSTDGSFPTWLSRDLKVIPVLDRSAQSALPAWFLAEYANARRETTASGRAERAARLCADFLKSEVVPKALYYDFETFFSCSPKGCLQRDGRLDAHEMWDSHSQQAPQNTLSMQWTAEALGALANPPAEAVTALDTMSLYQEVWPISWIKTAYVYGGFGVQNSDGEYNDARQAQFGSTLCEFGAKLGRKDYFQRGVAAIRASLTLINHPLHEKLGLYPNPNYPLGLEPENCCHGGTDSQDGRTGFDWGEGSGLAAAAEVLDKYGTTYRSPHGWTVQIDAVPAPVARASTLLVDPQFPLQDWRMPGWTIEGDFLHWPTRSVRQDFNAGGKPFIGTCEDGLGGYEDAYTGAMTSPSFTVTKPKIKLRVGGGSGLGEYVELVDAENNRLRVERGRDSEFMSERVWDVSALKGKSLRIRIVDDEKGPWGHINVGQIRCVE